MMEQKLTISGLYRPGWSRWPAPSPGGGEVPYLPLEGTWLGEAGFLPGTRVLVEVVADGELVVRRVEEGETAEAVRSARPVPEPHEELDLDREREAVHA